MHCGATVVLRKQLNFKSAVIRSNRSSCYQLMIRAHRGPWGPCVVGVGPSPLVGNTTKHLPPHSTGEDQDLHLREQNAIYIFPLL